MNTHFIFYKAWIKEPAGYQFIEMTLNLLSY